MTPTTIHMASDHAGYGLKSDLYRRLSSLGHNLIDHGTDSTSSCDYPLYAQKLCKSLLSQGGLGILVCGSGLGMSMAANRFAGIRAAVCCNEFMARVARLHNNANVLCLGERIIGIGLASSIVDVFLSAAFEGDRHQKRINLIENQE